MQPLVLRVTVFYMPRSIRQLSSLLVIAGALPLWMPAGEAKDLFWVCTDAVTYTAPANMEMEADRSQYREPEPRDQTQEATVSQVDLEQVVNPHHQH